MPNASSADRPIIKYKLVLKNANRIISLSEKRCATTRVPKLSIAKATNLLTVKAMLSVHARLERTQAK